MIKNLSTGLLLLELSAIGFTQGKIILRGQVKQSDGSPLRHSAVMLIQYNPATKGYSLTDSSYTDAEGNFRFDNQQQYFLLAIPDESAEDELPAYYGNTLFLQNAHSFTLNFGEAVIADFATVRKTSLQAGNASVGGTILLEKNLSPSASITVFLADKEKRPIAVTFINSSGSFQFNHLPQGEYYLWIDLPWMDNTTADPTELNQLNPKKDDLHFRIEDGILNCVEDNYSSIQDALENKENVYILNLNSIQHDAVEKSLVMLPDGTKILSPQIGEFKNLESLSIEVNMIHALPSELGKLEKLMLLSANLNKLTALPDEIKNLKNLKTLHLGKNGFNKFPDVIAELQSLEVLNMESNPITTISPALNSLKNLKELNLANCFDLLSLPVQIGELSNLETLNLSNCIKLKSLPREIKNLKNLKILDISGTKLSVKEFKKAVPQCEVRMTKK